MKPRTLLRRGKQGLKNMGRNGWMTFASISSVTVALLLVGFFSALMMNLNHITNQIKNDVKVKVYISLTATQAQKQQLQEEIEALPRVAHVNYIPKKKGWEKFIGGMGDYGEVFKSMKSNPLPDAFEVDPKRPEDSAIIAGSMKKMDHVKNVNYGKGTVEKLFSVTHTARNIGIVIILGLLFTAIFLIGNTIKLTIVSRRSEIEIMKLVGATNAFIRWPFFAEGLILGILGSVIPIGLLLLVYSGFYHFFYSNYAMTFINLIPMNPTIYYLSAILLLIGACIGVWGSVMSVRRFLKV